MEKNVILSNGAVFSKVDGEYTLVEIEGIKMYFKTSDIRLEEGLLVRENYKSVYRLIVRYNSKERINFMEDVPLNVVKKLYNFGIQVNHASVNMYGV